MVFSRVLVFIIALALGIGVIVYTEWIVRNAGKFGWFESKMSGSTYSVWKLIGLAIIIAGFLYMIYGIPGQ